MKHNWDSVKKKKWKNAEEQIRKHGEENMV